MDRRKPARVWIIRLAMILIISLAGLEGVLQAAHAVVSKNAARKAITDPSAPVIICLGDSHTYGAGVESAQSYPARLEAMIREAGLSANVVNLGAPGRNTSEIRRALPGWLEEYHPAAVIVLASVNNGWNRQDAAWSDAQDGLTVSFSTRAADFLLTRIRTIRAACILIHRLDWAGPEEEIAHDRNGALVIHRREEYEQPEIAYDRARRDLRAIVARIRAAHAAPLLMTYVTDPDATFTVPNHLLRETAADMKVAIADNDQALRPLFMRPDGSMDRSVRGELFFPDMHPRDKGYEAIAKNVIKALAGAGVPEFLVMEGGEGRGER